MILGLGYIFYSCIAELAGKTTLAYFFINLFANITVQAALAVSVSGVSIAYGLWQRRLKKKTTELLHVRIKELESGIDVNRTSSGLTKQGETNPQDRI